MFSSVTTSNTSNSLDLVRCEHSIYFKNAALVRSQPFSKASRPSEMLFAANFCGSLHPCAVTVVPGCSELSARSGGSVASGEEGESPTSTNGFEQNQPGICWLRSDFLGAASFYRYLRRLSLLNLTGRVCEASLSASVCLFSYSHSLSLSQIVRYISPVSMQQAVALSTHPFISCVCLLYLCTSIIAECGGSSRGKTCSLPLVSLSLCQRMSASAPFVYLYSSMSISIILHHSKMWMPANLFQNWHRVHYMASF